MHCLESTLGSEVYFTLITAIVFAVMNLVKRISFVPGDLIPALAFMLGWMIDGVCGELTCGLSHTAAALSGLGGGIAGLAAAGGHEALSRALKKFGLESLANRLLGKAKTITVIVVLAAMTQGCAMLPQILKALPQLVASQQGAQHMASILTMVGSHVEKYFARHPNLTDERAVADAASDAESALSVYNAVLNNGGNVEALRKLATDKASAFRDLLKKLGIPQALSPGGGAETNEPPPVPFTFPEPATVLR